MSSELGQLVELPSELNAGSIRKLHTDLTSALPHLDGAEFVWALIYKGLFEELLRNLIEDDRVPNWFALDSARLLTESFSEALVAGKGDYSAWLSSVVGFATLWRDLPTLRKHLPMTDCRSLRFAVATGQGAFLWGAPMDRQLNDPSYRFFPSLDDSILDPSASRPLVEWFVEEIERFSESGVRDGAPITNLVFVEKPFSYVGAVLLASQLVKRTNVPGLIYRSAYWDDSAKFRGPRPTPGGRAILIYDVSIHGSILLEAAEQLRNQHGITTAAALVGYDFSHGAQAALAEHRIQLRSFDTRQAAESELLKIEKVHSAIDLDALVSAGIADANGRPRV